jgi:hypothetical protein
MNTRTRPTTIPAYYLGRPATLWLTALTRRQTDRTAPRRSCAGEVSGSSPAEV